MTARPALLSARTADTASRTAGAYCLTGVQEQSIASANYSCRAARSGGACMLVKPLLFHTMLRYDTFVAVSGSRHPGCPASCVRLRPASACVLRDICYGGQIVLHT